MLPLGTIAPSFSLPDVDNGKIISFPQRHDAEGTVVMFICNHCPYVKHIAHELSRLGNDYLPKNIDFYAINSNDISQYPDDAPDKMRVTALFYRYPFPYLYDESQEVAKLYQAACTPDFFVFNKNLELVYRGQLDDSRPGNDISPSGASIRHALDCLLNHQDNQEPQTPSLGCNIKWKEH